MMDVCSADIKPMLTLEEALEKINSALSPVDDTETIDLKNAKGRVLAHPLYSALNLPGDRNAAMDGYAFSSSDKADEQAFTLRLAGTSWAGRPFNGVLERGLCIRIFTGAIVPESLDSVIMQEQVSADGDAVHFPAHTRTGQNIREAGEDVKKGGLLCAAPKKLTIADMGLLAAAGIADCAVKRRL
ncbi:MAG: molybdopterin molybdenumtransferase MoeA, partial [Methylovulum sp.]